MKHLFASLELALLVKEKGFDDPCFGVYYANTKEHPITLEIRDNKDLNSKFIRAKANRLCVAPLYQQVIDWLREEHKIDVAPIYCIEYPLDKDLRRKGYGGNVYLIDKDENIASYFGITYYDALSEGIKEALKLLK